MGVKAYSSREFIRIIKKDGWRLKNVAGDHYQFEHPTKPGKLTVMHPVGSYSERLLRKMFKDAGIEPPK